MNVEKEDLQKRLWSIYREMGLLSPSERHQVGSQSPPDVSRSPTNSISAPHPVITSPNHPSVNRPSVGVLVLQSRGPPEAVG